MVARKHILVVSREKKLRDRVATALKESHLGVLDLARDLENARAVLAETAPSAVLVDLDGDAAATLRRMEELGGRFPQTRFVVLAEALDHKLVLTSMQAGARHFLVKSTIESELRDVLEKLLPGTEEGQGRLVTVLSASGGCGATSVAVNLACEFHAARKRPTLLVDLDTSYGTIATYLGLSAQYGIADVLSSSERIDPQLISSTSVPYAEQVSVLLSPISVDPTNPRPLNLDHLEASMTACKQAYACTVVDAPRLPLAATVILAQESDLTLIVFEMTVNDVRMAGTIWDQLCARGVPAGRVLGVANRFCKRRQVVTLDEAKKVLRGLTVETIRNDYKSASKGLNFGQPLSKAAPRSVLRRDLEKLALQL